MPVKAMGDHARGIDLLRGVSKALRMAISLLQPGSKESDAAVEAFQKIGRTIHMGDQGKEDAVDPMQRVQQAIMARRMMGARPPGQPGAPPMAAPPQPNRGPIPAPA
jgi:hypothetical protein